MSVSSSSPHIAQPARYVVVIATAYLQSHILDRYKNRRYFFGNPKRADHRFSYSERDAWAVCDWLNGRPNPVRADHRDLEMTA